MKMIFTKEGEQVAVSFKKDNFLLELGANPDVVKFLDAEGWEFTYGIYNLSATHKGLGLSAQHKLAVTVDSLLKGATTSTHKMAAVSGINSWLKGLGADQASKIVGEALNYSHGGTITGSLKTGTVNVTLHDKKPSKATEAKVPEAVGEDYAKSAKPIKLKDATSLLTPVTGTTSGSRYYVVALGDGFNVAARIAGTGLSIRVEGKTIPQSVIKAFETIGVSSKGNYLSGHFTLNKSTPEKAVGALLFSVGLSFRGVITNIAAVKELPNES